MAWFGFIDLSPRLVETAIALSIAYVAVENLMDRGRGHRWLLAGGFGLVHGDQRHQGDNHGVLFAPPTTASVEQPRRYLRSEVGGPEIGVP